MLTHSELLLTAIVTFVFSVLAGMFAISTGLFTITLATDMSSVARTAAIALVLPALVEELVFRGPLIWIADHRASALLAASGVSLLLFVLWHPLNGLLLMTEAGELFTDWRFITLASALGAAATWLAVRTRSIWPPVIFHWLVVVGWRVFLGGPQFL